MALAVKEPPCSILFASHSSPTSTSFIKSPFSIRFHISVSAPAAAASLNFASCSSSFARALRTTTRRGFQLRSAVESVESVELGEKVGKQPKPDNRRKLFVLNLPWSFSVEDIKTLFGECGTVADVEIIKRKDGKNRGFAFVTMSSAEEAQAAIEKFDSYELVGRIIKVQFSKRFKRPPPPPPSPPAENPFPRGRPVHKLYVSNLPWKARSTNLRDFFASGFNPVSARVVFDSPTGRSSGYGFVSFATKEEAESAISTLDGKELMGRPIRLKFSERNDDASEGKDEESNKEENAEEPNKQEGDE